ncbi:MAG: mannitol-1-phosphate 5-dehydrogenase [Buchnera aphidicola (Nurudea yanoniella)]
MQALHFGAGNIGRGFIGQILVNSGFNLFFSDINKKIIDAINFFNEYSIKILGDNSFVEKVKNVQAIHIHDDNILSVIENSDIITTAVGVNTVNSLANILATGIIQKIRSGKKKFLNIMACENAFRCSSELKKHVLSFLPKRYHQYLEDNIGFIDTVVDRIVLSDIKNDNNILLVETEEFKEFICDINQFRGSVPNVSNMQLSTNLNAYSERKLFTLNTGHVITAYVGLIYGYTNVFDAISDKFIYDIVYGAMCESGNVLISRYNFEKIIHDKYIRAILFRFKNPYLSDDLKRVGRNPLRKLQKNDRLIKPLLGTLEYHFSNINLVKGIAAALCYTNIDDNEAIKLNDLIKNKGVDHVLLNISCLCAKSSIIHLIKKHFYLFKKKICI